MLFFFSLRGYICRDCAISLQILLLLLSFVLPHIKMFLLRSLLLTSELEHVIYKQILFNERMSLFAVSMIS